MESTLTLRDYLSILTQRWWIVALSLALCVSAALLWTATRTPLYQAQTSILVNQVDSSELFDPASGTSSGGRATENEARFLRSDLVATEAINRLGYEAKISVSTENGADVLGVTAVSADPDRAQAIAQTFSEAYIQLRRSSATDNYTEILTALLDQVTGLDLQIADAATDTERLTFEARRGSLNARISDLSITSRLITARAEIINPAELPETPFTPQTSRNLMLGAVLGLIMGVGAALLLETLDVSIRTTSELEAVTNGLPNLAAVRTMDKQALAEHNGLVTLSPQHETSPEAEPYRTLRAALQFAAIDRDLTMLQVTSSMPSEGKSTTASNLAAVLAKNNQRVLLIDCDLRKPRLHNLFDVPQEPGVTSILIGECTPAEAMHPIATGEGSLSLITSGPIPPGPSELLSSAATADLFDLLRGLADYIVIDSPPVLPVSDALVLSRYADATILVANASSSSQQQVEQAMELLERVEAPLLGTVLNQVGRRRGFGSYGYGHGYGYGYGYGHTVEKSPRINNPFRGRPQNTRRATQPNKPTEPSPVAAADNNNASSSRTSPNHDTNSDHLTASNGTGPRTQRPASPQKNGPSKHLTNPDKNHTTQNTDTNTAHRSPATPKTRQEPPIDTPTPNGTNPFSQLVDGDGWLDDDITLT